MVGLLVEVQDGARENAGLNGGANCAEKGIGLLLVLIERHSSRLSEIKDVFKFFPREARSGIVSLVSDVTQLLDRVQQGDQKASEELLPLVYDELRRLAAAQMAREAPGQTLQPTALVHEAWLRLGGDEQPNWQNRAHFFASAAEAMRRILIEKARRRRSIRRGGGLDRVDLDELEIAAPEDDERLLEINDALDRLVLEDPLRANVVKLRFFVGLSQLEVANALGLSERTIERHWAYAKVWLLRAIREQN